MTDRIAKTFADLNHRNEAALVGFVTAGDPDPDTSLALVESMCRAGIDVLELGVPFSDPTADGPVIQRSSARALEHGMSLRQVLELTRRLRQTQDVPVILFSYYNPIHAYGPAAFYSDALGAGADGVLIVDLPPEESDELTAQWPDNSLSLIRLVAPTTPPERMARIAASASGFLYLVSKTGVTGSSGLDLDEIRRQSASLKTYTHLPVCVGFGISTPDDVAAVAAAADGVVIGSAFERLIEANLDAPDLAQKMADKVAACKAATRRGAGIGGQ